MKAMNLHALFIVSLAQSVFLASMGTSMANLALPAIGSAFGVEFSHARLVVLGYLLAITAFSLWVGRVSDVKGRTGTLALGMSVFMVAAFVAAFARSFPLLILARVLQGMGAAALVALPIVIATETLSSKILGRIIGLFATMSAIGTASGPSLGGWVLSSFCWRGIFVAMALLAGVNLLLLAFTARRTGEKTTLQPSSLKFIEVLSLFARDSDLRRKLLYQFVVSAVMMTTLVVGPYFLSNNLNLSPAVMGMSMSAGPITSMVFGTLSGFVVDRFGVRLTLTVGFAQLMIGATAFVLLGHWRAGVGFAFSAVLLSLGYQLFLSANSSALMEVVASDRRGLASGALTLARNLGLIAGTTVFSAVFDWIGFRATFIGAALLIAISFGSFLIHEQRRINGTRFLV